MSGFDEAQKQYLLGLASGLAIRRATHGPTVREASKSGAVGAADTVGTQVDAIHHQAQDRAVAAGGKLVAEETAKRTKHPFDNWDELVRRADMGEFPKGTDVFLTKFYGLFYVAPAQNSYMCRLRIPNGILNSWQVRGIAQIAEQLGGGYADVTTRANLQIREISAHNAVKVYLGIVELGLTTRGSGADNIRNVTGSPTAGVDPQELIDTRPMARALHHHILHHREMYGLPRKFNIAFDGGGCVGVLEDTNDIGFVAVEVKEGRVIPAGIYFRLQLGGITGHLDFARDTGVLVKSEECTAVAAAIVRAFIEHGDRTNRQKARLKYVLDRMGLDAFLAEVQKHLPAPLRRVSLDDCEPRRAVHRQAHIGVQKQKQPGLNYLGIVVPVGRLTAAQLQGIADIADEFGSGTVRLTVWQNLLISDIPDSKVAAAQRAIEAIGLHWRGSAVRAGLVACTGSTGCKFSAANTKGQAMALADYLDARVALDGPVNIHLTGCHHSCAQHYIGDIGLLACKVEVGSELVEGYTVYIGGGSAAAGEQALAREYQAAVPFDAVPALIETLLKAYLDRRAGPDESFHRFCARHDIDTLRDAAAAGLIAAAGRALS